MRCLNAEALFELVSTYFIQFCNSKTVAARPRSKQLRACYLYLGFRGLGWPQDYSFRIGGQRKFLLIPKSRSWG